jgi:hypothetical protein
VAKICRIVAREVATQAQSLAGEFEDHQALGYDLTDQALHRDQNAFDFYPFPDDYHVQCNTLWAMTDYTEEMGATLTNDRAKARSRRDLRMRTGIETMRTATETVREMMKDLVPVNNLLG